MARPRYSELLFCGVVLAAVVPVMAAYDACRWLKSIWPAASSEFRVG